MNQVLNNNTRVSFDREFKQQFAGTSKFAQTQDNARSATDILKLYKESDSSKPTTERLS